MRITAKLTSKKQINALIILSVAVYFFSYITRINYTAVIVELIAAGVASKPQTALVTTVAFITYGVGQLVSGFVGDRVSPRWLIFFGFAVTVTVNLLMPSLSHNFLIMALAWGINGVAQAFMWPPLVKIFSSALSDNDYSRAVTFIGMGSSAATIAIYLFAPIIIDFAGWKYVFYISGSIALVGSLFWIILSGRLLKNVEITGARKVKAEVIESSESDIRLARYLMKILPIIIITIAIQGVLRDGITTWTPSFMSESFNMKASKSIFTVIGSSVFHLVMNILTYKVLKFFKNDIFKAITLYFSVSFLSLAVLRVFSMKSAVPAFLLISLATGIVHGINLLQTAYIPKYFISTGKVSTMSGIMNFATYIGSAVSTYLFAVIAEKLGWDSTVTSWICFALAGVLLNLAIHSKIKKLF